MEVVLLQSAQADLMELYSRHGEATYFAVDHALEAIRTMPELAPIFHAPFRRKVVPDTPFGIFYVIEGDRLMISFIMDLRQNPRVLEKRLKW